MGRCEMGGKKKRYQRLSVKTPLKLCYRDPHTRVLCMIWSVGGVLALSLPSLPFLSLFSSRRRGRVLEISVPVPYLGSGRKKKYGRTIKIKKNFEEVSYNTRTRETVVTASLPHRDLEPLGLSLPSLIFPFPSFPFPFTSLHFSSLFQGEKNGERERA
ncbi:hypothetical protein HOY80DRAFT_978552 [Tuber brumale]|nr:hypothetical protein HOY80DRAFT_978552 [Tuber brumale]